MAKRKLCQKVILEKGRQEEDDMEVMKKRTRRISDVIDSIGDRDDDSPSGLSTPRGLEMDNEAESPEQRYSVTSEPADMFMPDWLTKQKSTDFLDAGPFNPSSDEEATLSVPSGASGLSARMTVDKDAECYNMNHNNRGKCVVFNHEIFDTGFERRDGSTLDAKRIERTFTNLGFEVEILDNLEHSKVVEKINELSNDDHTDNDCICIFMLTHGLAPDMIFAKDVAYKAEKIWKPFTADKCTTLAGKPKLFFFQACRGNELDAGVQLHHRRLAAFRSETDSSSTSYKLPTHADFLIAHSTVQGHYSWRNPSSGTWFIQCLCDALDEYSPTTDFQKILTICSRRVAIECSSYNDLNPTKHDQKQVPSITSMLIRDIYFTAK